MKGEAKASDDGQAKPIIADQNQLPKPETQDWRGSRWSIVVKDSSKDPRFKSAVPVGSAGGGDERMMVRWSGLPFGLPARSFYVQGIVDEKEELVGAFLTFSTSPSEGIDPSDEEKERLLHAMSARCIMIKWRMQKDTLEYKMCSKKVKKLEAQLDDFRAENINKYKFLRTMSHELRTPMNAVKVCLCESVFVYVCVCVCLCVYIYIYIYIYIRVSEYISLRCILHNGFCNRHCFSRVSLTY